MKVLSNNKTMDAVLSFPTLKSRTEFFATNCLEKYGVSEKPVQDKDTDCFVNNVNLNDIIKIIKFAKNNFGAEYHLNCGGSNLTDCGNYESKNGSLCGYCQYMEFD